MKLPRTIYIAEPSEVIYEGLAAIIRRTCPSCEIKHVTDFQLLEKNLGPSTASATVIINPSFIQYQQKHFSEIRAEYTSVVWIAFVYALMDPKMNPLFDHIVTANDPAQVIVDILHSKPSEKLTEPETPDILSEREKDVLIHLTAGLSNKEIADQLNISINTVITHRKNISQKTGIKTVSGLTIYAVLNQIISIEKIR